MQVRYAFAGMMLAAPLTPIAAQDVGSKNFVGPHVEADFGWEQVRFEADTGGGNRDSQDFGLNYGAAAGYDVALGSKLVAGLEAALSYSTTDDRVEGSYGYETGRDLAITGRLGARLGQNALLYGKLGYTNLAVRYFDGVQDVDHRKLDGLLVGLGAEWDLGSSMYLKEEYRYSNYENGVSRHQLLNGIGIRF